MKCSILTIGDEILIGQVVDTNSAWLGQQLNDLGIVVKTILSVSDDNEQITEGLKTLSKDVELILVTGGLGPTKDDITKLALADFFGDTLVYNEEMHQKIRKLFRKWGRKPTALHKMQCYLPSKAILLENNLGTAPGMWFEKNAIIYVSLPGVPYEMKGIFVDHLSKRLRKITRESNHIIHKTILTAGEGESILSEKFKDIQTQIPHHIKLAFLPSLGQVRIRLTGVHINRYHLESELEFWIKMISDRIGRVVYSYDTDTLEAALGRLCKEKSVQLASAESCTGGYFAHRITSVPGSSVYFSGSVVAYSNELKQNLLKVKKQTIMQEGAVSEATAREMLVGLLENTPAKLGVSITGIAGPDGGTPEKPVGTIWLAWGTLGNLNTHCLHLSKDRLQNIEYTTNFAMNALRLFLMKEELK